MGAQLAAEPLSPSELTEVHKSLSDFEDLGEEYERVLRRVFECVLRPGDTAVDVGAHTGKHTLPMALAVANGGVGSAGRVLAFEPIPWAAERLEHRLELCGLSDWVEIFNGCCGATGNTSVTFTEVPDRPGWSSKHVRGTAGETIEFDVPQTTLDLALAASEVRAIKIDVEGAELEVLQGAQGAIDGFAPVIHIEVATDAIESFGYTCEDLRAFLIGNNYELFDLLGNNVSSPTLWEAATTSRYFFDFLAVHQSDPDKSDILEVLSHSFLPERLDALLSHPSLLHSRRPTPVVPKRRFVADALRFIPSSAFSGPPIAIPPSLPQVGQNRLISVNVNPPVQFDVVGGHATRLPPGSEVALPLHSIFWQPSLNSRLSLSIAGVGMKQSPQTLVEFQFASDDLVGLVRTTGPRLECLWLRDGAVVDRSATKRGSGSEFIVNFDASNEGLKLAALQPSDSNTAVVSTEPVDDLSGSFCLGRRTKWANPEEVKSSKVWLTVEISTLECGSDT